MEGGRALSVSPREAPEPQEGSDRGVAAPEGSAGLRRATHVEQPCRGADREGYFPGEGLPGAGQR
jgi:hypothetical protein